MRSKWLRNASEITIYAPIMLVPCISWALLCGLGKSIDILENVSVIFLTKFSSSIS